jgi:predicted ATPase with chaperone activity
VPLICHRPFRAPHHTISHAGLVCGDAAAAGRAMNLSARAHYQELKLARTIVNLARSERIQPAHIAQPIEDRPRSSTANQYRPRRQE